MPRKSEVITAATLSMPDLTIRAAHRFLELNGVEWSMGWLKTQVALGAIPSQKIHTSRVIKKTTLEKIIEDHRRK